MTGCFASDVIARSGPPRRSTSRRHCSFAVARQQLELSPEDARELGIADGESVDVSQNGTRLRAIAAVRSGAQPGTAFLAEGLASDSANALTEPTIEIAKR